MHLKVDQVFARIHDSRSFLAVASYFMYLILMFYILQITMIVLRALRLSYPPEDKIPKPEY